MYVVSETLVLERLQTIVDYIPQIARINSLRGFIAISLNRPIAEFGVGEPTLGRGSMALLCQI